MRIVPPAITVTPVPSPNAAIASSRDVGTTTCAASSDVAVKCPLLGRAESRRFCHAQRYRGSDGVRDDRRARGGGPRRVVPPRPGALYGALPRLDAGEAAAARRRSGRGQDRGGEGARDGDVGAADPASVLRGPRRRARGVRVELLAAAPPHPCSAGGDGLGAGAVRAGLPDPPAATRGDRERGSRGAPD